MGSKVGASLFGIVALFCLVVAVTGPRVDVALILLAAAGGLFAICIPAIVRWNSRFRARFGRPPTFFSGLVMPAGDADLDRERLPLLAVYLACLALVVGSYVVQ